MSDKSVSIVWKPKVARIAQIFGKGLEYAFVSPDNQQVHQFVYCKDFLQDTIHAYLNNTTVSLYSFRYNGNDSTPITLDSTKILIASYRDSAFRKKINPIIDFLNQIEDVLGMKKTKVYGCASPMPTYKRSGVFMLKGSKRWMKAPPMISLYSFLIRLGCAHQEGASYKDTLQGIFNGSIKPYQSMDATYLKDSLHGIDFILKMGDRKIFHNEIKRNYPRSITKFDDMHNNCGLIGYCKGQAKVHCPYWYRDFKAGA